MAGSRTCSRAWRAASTGPGPLAAGWARAAGPYSLLCVESTPRSGPPSVSIGIGYLALLLLGAAEGLIGCFQFSRGAGPVPVAALVFCVLLFASCLLGGWGMGTPLGALMVALGWFGVSVLLTMPSPGGSVIVTNTTAGRWFLYGGAVCAGAGLAVSFRWRTRRPARLPRLTPGTGP